MAIEGIVNIADNIATKSKEAGEDISHEVSTLYDNLKNSEPLQKTFHEV